MTGDLLSRLVAEPDAVASLDEPLPDADVHSQGFRQTREAIMRTVVNAQETISAPRGMTR